MGRQDYTLIGSVAPAVFLLGAQCFVSCHRLSGFFARKRKIPHVEFHVQLQLYAVFHDVRIRIRLPMKIAL